MCDGYYTIHKGMTGGSNPPLSKLTVSQLRELLDGYCDTCPHLDDINHLCESGCAIPRINADLVKFIDEKEAEALREFRAAAGRTAVPTNLAFRFKKEVSK